MGILIGISNQTDCPSNKLKRALRNLDANQAPTLSAPILSIVRWSAAYYHHPIGEAVWAAVPTYLRNDKPITSPYANTIWRVTEQGALSDYGLTPQAHKQRAALEALRAYSNGLSETAIKQLGFKKETLKQLERKNLVHHESRDVDNTATITTEQIKAEPNLSLNQEQQFAFEQIAQCLAEFRCHALYGITGSGKTEIYLQTIEQILIQQKQSLVIVPEISLTPQTVMRFRKRFNTHIACIHSRQTDLEKYQAWYDARTERAKIIIGTRSALFTDLPNIGLIIVDEEHDSSLKQQEGFRYNARDLAVFRAKKENIPIILGSGTPSLETLQNTESKNYQLSALNQRAGDAQPPKISVIDLRKHRSHCGLSKPALNTIEQALSQKQQVIIFINRRGFAPILICNDCGWSAQCPACDARLVVHKNPTHLRCHHCETNLKIISHCKTCGSSDLTTLGQGTEKIEDFLLEQFPGYPVLRIDRDTTKERDAMARTIQKVNTGEPMILVGTQMIAKGHHFPSVTKVILIDTDSGLLSADFRGSEKTLQLITQVAGRAGRERLPGEVHIQTRLPEHPLLQQLLRDGYLITAQTLLTERKDAGFPPFGHLVLFRANSTKLEKANELLQRIKTIAAREDQEHHLELYGPAPAPMAKRAGKHRAQLLVRSDHRGSLHKLLNRIIEQIDTSHPPIDARWSVDVDPIDLY